MGQLCIMLGLQKNMRKENYYICLTLKTHTVTLWSFQGSRTTGGFEGHLRTPLHNLGLQKNLRKENFIF